MTNTILEAHKHKDLMDKIRDCDNEQVKLEIIQSHFIAALMQDVRGLNKQRKQMESVIGFLTMNLIVMGLVLTWLVFKS